MKAAVKLSKENIIKMRMRFQKDGTRGASKLSLMVAMHCGFGLSYCLMIWGYPIAALITFYPFHTRAKTFRHILTILTKEILCNQKISL